MQLDKGHVVAYVDGMAVRRPAQEKIRSDSVKRRNREAIAPGLKRLDWMLVAEDCDARSVMLDEANAELDAIRSGDRD